MTVLLEDNLTNEYYTILFNYFFELVNIDRPVLIHEIINLFHKYPKLNETKTRSKKAYEKMTFIEAFNDIIRQLLHDNSLYDDVYEYYDCLVEEEDPANKYTNIVNFLKNNIELNEPNFLKTINASNLTEATLLKILNKIPNFLFIANTLCIRQTI